MNMKNLKEILSETYNHKAWWNYYSGENGFDIFSSDGCKDFVKSFFLKSGKADLFRFLPKRDLCSERWQHIVYVFLLGIYIYQKSSYHGAIEDEIKVLNDKSKTDVKFEFVWFLICLCHDLYHSSEDDLSEDFFDSCKFKKACGVPNLFDKLPLRYYFYRRLQGKNDHGVVTGFKMYDELCKIRKQQESKMEESQNGTTLIWNKELNKIYKYTAWIVACHNMWFKHSYIPSDVSSCTLYRLLGLDGLIFNSKYDIAQYKQKCKKKAIFRLFCIIDTIEVIKVVCNTDDLEKVKMDVSNDGITIDVSESKDKEKLKNNIESLDEWIVDIESIKDRGLYSFKIKL